MTSLQEKGQHKLYKERGAASLGDSGYCACSRWSGSAKAEEQPVVPLKSLALSVRVDMRRLARVLLVSAIGIVSSAGNVTTGELQGEVATTTMNVGIREMKSTDWDGQVTETPLANLSLDALLEVFNPQHLARRWNSQHANITDECSAHMNQYLTHLQKGALWALKSE